MLRVLRQNRSEYAWGDVTQFRRDRHEAVEASCVPLGSIAKSPKTAPNSKIKQARNQEGAAPSGQMSEYMSSSPLRRARR